MAERMVRLLPDVTPLTERPQPEIDPDQEMIRWHCSRCRAVGAWIVPRPEMRLVVEEIARAKGGWVHESLYGTCLCPYCANQASAKPRPVPRTWNRVTLAILLELHQGPRRKSVEELAALHGLSHVKMRLLLNRARDFDARAKLEAARTKRAKTEAWLQAWA